MNHITIGVYANGEFKVNVVSDGDLSNHIEFNKTFRPGRALFVNGECLNQGYLSNEDIDTWKSKISTMNIDNKFATKPYV